MIRYRFNDQLAVDHFLFELARLRESCIKGHGYQIGFIVGTVFITCEREPNNHHSDWAI